MTDQKKKTLKLIKRHIGLLGVLIEEATTADQNRELMKAKNEAYDLFNQLSGFSGAVK